MSEAYYPLVANLLEDDVPSVGPDVHVQSPTDKNNIITDTLTVAYDGGVEGSGDSLVAPIIGDGPASDVEKALHERIFVLSRQLEKSQDEAASMRAAFARRSAMCRQEISTVVHEYVVSSGSVGTDASRNAAIGRYVNFINAVTDGLTEEDMGKRMEEAHGLFKRYSVGAQDGGLAALTSPGSPTEGGAGGVSGLTAALTDPSSMGQTLDRIVELRNERDDLQHRLTTLGIRYKLLVEKLRGQEVAHARITKDLEHRCDVLGRREIALNHTINRLEAQLVNAKKDQEALRMAFAQHRKEAGMERDLTNAQIAQLEVSLRAEVLRRDPASLNAMAASASTATGALALACAISARPCVEYACDLLLDGTGVMRNPSREMLERLVAECSQGLDRSLAADLAAVGPGDSSASVSAPFLSAATAAKALCDRVAGMQEELSLWRIVAVTAQTERNKAEARCIAVSEEMGRIQEIARDRKVDLPFDVAHARARAALHSFSDDKANFREMARTLRSELYESAKRVHRLRRALEALVVPEEVIAARDAAAAAAKANSTAHLYIEGGGYGGGAEYTNLGSLEEEIAMLEAIEGDIRQSLVDNIVWRKAAQRDLAIAHDQVITERSVWVQQWHVLLDGLPAEVAASIRCDGLGVLSSDASVATLVSAVEHSRNVMMAEAWSVMRAAEESMRQGRHLLTSGVQTDPQEGTLLTDAQREQMIAEAIAASNDSSPMMSPKGATGSRRMVEMATQTARRWYTGGGAMGAQRVGVFDNGAAMGDDDGSAFLTQVGGASARRGSSVRSQGPSVGPGDDEGYDVKDAGTMTSPSVVTKSVYVQASSPRTATIATGADEIVTRDQLCQTELVRESIGTVTDPPHAADFGVQCDLITGAGVGVVVGVFKAVQTDAPLARSIAVGGDLAIDDQNREQAVRSYLLGPSPSSASFPSGAMPIPAPSAVGQGGRHFEEGEAAGAMGISPQSEVGIASSDRQPVNTPNTCLLVSVGCQTYPSTEQDEVCRALGDDGGVCEEEGPQCSPSTVQPAVVRLGMPPERFTDCGQQTEPVPAVIWDVCDCPLPARRALLPPSALPDDLRSFASEGTQTIFLDWGGGASEDALGLSPLPSDVASDDEHEGSADSDDGNGSNVDAELKGVPLNHRGHRGEGGASALSKDAPARRLGRGRRKSQRSEVGGDRQIPTMAEGTSSSHAASDGAVIMNHTGSLGELGARSRPNNHSRKREARGGHRSPRSAVNVFTFEALAGPIVGTRSAEVQVCIRKPRSHTDVGVQWEGGVQADGLDVDAARGGGGATRVGEAALPTPLHDATVCALIGDAAAVTTVHDVPAVSEDMPLEDEGTSPTTFPAHPNMELEFPPAAAAAPADIPPLADVSGVMCELSNKSIASGLPRRVASASSRNREPKSTSRGVADEHDAMDANLGEGRGSPSNLPSHSIVVAVGVTQPPPISVGIHAAHVGTATMLNSEGVRVPIRFPQQGGITGYATAPAPVVDSPRASVAYHTEETCEPEKRGVRGRCDAAAGPGLFWRVADKCVGTDLDSRALRDLNFADTARSMMGVRVQQPTKQEQLGGGDIPKAPPQLYSSTGHYIGSPHLHPGSRRLPRLSNGERSAIVGVGGAEMPSAPAGPASVSSVVRVLEPLGVLAGGGSTSGAVGFSLRRSSADPKGRRVTQAVAAGPGMRKGLTPLTPEEELRAQMLARSQSPPFPMFHHSAHNTSVGPMSPVPNKRR